MTTTDIQSDIYCEIEQELSAIKSFGVEFKNITISNNHLYIGSPYIKEAYLKEIMAMNTPEVIVRFTPTNSTLNITNNFRLAPINKDELYQSAIKHYEPDIPKNIQYIVEYHYQTALLNKRVLEQNITDSFLKKINGRYLYLIEAINKFNNRKTNGNQRG